MTDRVVSQCSGHLLPQNKQQGSKVREGMGSIYYGEIKGIETNIVNTGLFAESGQRVVFLVLSSQNVKDPLAESIPTEFL